MSRPGLAPGEWGNQKATRQSSTGRYRASAYLGLHDGTTERIQATAKTRGEALGRLQTKGEELLAQSASSAMGAGVPLGPWVKRCLDAAAAEGSITPGTQRAYRTAYFNLVPDAAPLWLTKDGRLDRRTKDRSHIRRIDHLTIGALTSADLRCWLASLEGVRTLDLAATVVRQALENAVAEELIAASPMGAVDAWLKGERKRRIRAAGGLTGAVALTEEMDALVLDALAAWQERPQVKAKGIGTRLTDVWLVMMETGLRIGEVLALRWQDLDLERAAAFICGTVVEDGGLHRQAHTKGHLAQWVGMGPGAVEVLRRLKAARVADPARPVFTISTGGWVAPSTYRNSLRRALDAAGVKVKLAALDDRVGSISPHSARRTVGTRLVNAPGGGVELARAQLRHSSSRITEAHYVDRARATVVAPELLGRTR